MCHLSIDAKSPTERKGILIMFNGPGIPIRGSGALMLNDSVVHRHIKRCGSEQCIKL
jgi:hypothetical protein